MSDIMDRLRQMADLFEAQQAPHNMVLHLRAAADEIERLRAALEWIDSQRYMDRSTINQENAFQKAVALNEKLLAVMDRARAALEGK